MAKPLSSILKGTNGYTGILNPILMELAISFIFLNKHLLKRVGLSKLWSGSMIATSWRFLIYKIFSMSYWAKILFPTFFNLVCLRFFKKVISFCTTSRTFSVIHWGPACYVLLFSSSFVCVASINHDLFHLASIL